MHSRKEKRAFAFGKKHIPGLRLRESFHFSNGPLRPLTFLAVVQDRDSGRR